MKVRGLIVAAVVAAPAMALAEDATQSLESPLGNGTGILFSTSASKTALTLGVSQQITLQTSALPAGGTEPAREARTGLRWEAGIEGAVKESATTSLVSFPSTGAGVFGPELKLRLGAGYSSFLAEDESSYEHACDDFMKGLKELRERERNDQCLAKVRELSEKRNIPAPAADTCAAAMRQLSEAMGQDPKLDTSVRKALEGMKDKLAPKADELQPENKIALKLLGDIVGLLAPEAEPKKKEEKFTSLCGAEPQLRNDQERALYEKTLKPHVTSPRRGFIVGLSGLAATSSINYRPMLEDGTFDLGSEKTWNGATVGAAAEVVYIDSGWFQAGLRAGYEQVLDVESVEICETTAQGAFTTRDCTSAVLGEPEPEHAVAAVLALQASPLRASFLNDVAFGVQLLARIRTAATDSAAMFQPGSWSGSVTVPFFLSGAKAPWGLKGGLAPQFEFVPGDSSKSVLTVLLFVGTTLDSQPIPVR